jgi:hypothetical protein
MFLLPLFVALQTRYACRITSRATRGARGQATTEYVLVLLGVAAIALFVATWATRSGKIGELLDRVFNSISSQIG